MHRLETAAPNPLIQSTTPITFPECALFAHYADLWHRAHQANPALKETVDALIAFFGAADPRELTRDWVEHYLFARYVNAGLDEQKLSEELDVLTGILELASAPLA